MLTTGDHFPIRMSLLQSDTSVAKLQEVAEFERSVFREDAGTALRRIIQMLESEKGVVFKHYSTVSTHIAQVCDGAGNELAYGLGKGVDSLLGAYGECIEHLVYLDIGKIRSVRLSLNEFQQTSTYRSDPAVRYAFSLSEAPDPVECLLFTSVELGVSHYVPCAFVNYNLLKDDLLCPFDRFTSRYCTTSGTAFGFREEDAYLHALNEIIERHVTSEYFLLLSGIPESLSSSFRFLRVETLPSYLRKLVDDILAQFEITDVELVIARTPFGSWWSFCVARPAPSTRFILPPWGAGASLHYDLAIYRSLSECLQMLENYEAGNISADERLLDFVKRYARFKSVATLPPPSELREVSYQSDLNISPIAVTQQIDTLEAAMAAQGHAPGRFVAHSDHGFNVVCAFAPGLERFYNITKGAAVLPMTYLRSLFA